MSAVSFVDSAGISVLVRAVISSRKLGGDIRLSGVRESVERIIRLVKLGELIKLSTTETEAIAALLPDERADELPFSD